MVSTSEFRNGMVIQLNGELFSIVEFQHVKPGKGVAFVRTRLKNVRTGAVLDQTFRSGDKVEDVRLERKAMQYLYGSEGMHYFMDVETYDQIAFPRETIEEVLRFLKENETVSVLTADEEPIGVELPFFVDLRVVKTDPGIRGDTATGGSKPATLETGTVVQVPLFMNEGDVIKVDTRTGEYIERVSSR